MVRCARKPQPESRSAPTIKQTKNKKCFPLFISVLLREGKGGGETKYEVRGTKYEVREKGEDMRYEVRRMEGIRKKGMIHQTGNVSQIRQL